MFAALNHPDKAYGLVAVDLQAETANPYKLVVMLFDGACLAVATAAEQHQQGNLMEMSRAIHRAVNIISNGLRASLDTSAGGELAGRLAALYDYLVMRLESANLRGNLAVFQEVSHLLAELQGAWKEIANDPAVLSTHAGHR